MGFSTLGNGTALLPMVHAAKLFYGPSAWGLTAAVATGRKLVLQSDGPEMPIREAKAA